MMLALDNAVKEILDERLGALEQQFDADALFYYGPFHDGLVNPFREQIESLRQDPKPKDRLVILLQTPGGSAESVEKLVDIIRYNYKEVYFIVPEAAMSAGTIFCMSGDKIYMDYSSSLGPIDPQIFNGKEWVPARGYLDEVQKMLQKATAGTITNAELLVWQSQDLAMLNRCEQQTNLTVTLLKKWLAEYKFKDWTMHQTDPLKKGQPVTDKEKEERATQIAEDLGNNKKWHSHGRRIGIDTLNKEIRLLIEDFSKEDELRKKIRSYSNLMLDYIQQKGFPAFLHTRKCF